MAAIMSSAEISASAHATALFTGGLTAYFLNESFDSRFVETDFDEEVLENEDEPSDALETYLSEVDS